MNKRLLLYCCGLAALCLLAYLPGLTSTFTAYDDGLYILENLDRLNQGLAMQWSAERAWNGEFVEYFPLRDSVYWFIYTTFGLRVLPFHLANLLFHITATLLVLRLLLDLGLEEKAALLATLLFAVHPVHIESVVWISGLKDPMYLTFMLLGLSAYARYRQRASTGRYVVMLAGLILALLVKAVAIVFPVLMLVMELLPAPKVRWTTVAARVAGPAIITALFFGTFMGIGRANRSITGPHGGSLMSHVVLSFWAQAKYLKQVLMPTSFRMIYCFEPPTGWLDWRLWVGVLAVAALGALAWRWRKQPLRLFLVTWYAVTMLPVSNLIPFPAIMADRYLYAPSVAACALLGILATQLSPSMVRLIAVSAAVLLTGATAARSWVWQDQEQLWIESDLDPACVLDTSYPAAQSHVLRSITTKDPYERMLALERALLSPGIGYTGKKMFCESLLDATEGAINLGEPERATNWAKLANHHCPENVRGWNLAMIINLHKNPQVAAMAAIKAFRLDRNPQTDLFVWLTLLDLNGDERAPREVLRLARLRQPAVCDKILAWVVDVPRFGPTLAEAVEVCLQR